MGASRLSGRDAARIQRNGDADDLELSCDWKGIESSISVLLCEEISSVYNVFPSLHQGSIAQKI
jgi:hypothetical protein